MNGDSNDIRINTQYGIIFFIYPFVLSIFIINLKLILNKNGKI